MTARIGTAAWHSECADMYDRDERQPFREPRSSEVECAKSKEGAVLTAERVRKLFSYNPDTGQLIRKVTASGINAHIGDVVGGINTYGYVRMSIDGRAYMAHRVIWLHVYGRWPLIQIDHINGDRADNRIANLRECSLAENARNRIEHRNGRLPGTILHRDGRRWQARRWINGRCKYLGLFDSEAEAHAAFIGAVK